MDLEETEAFTLKAYVSSRFIVMSHSVAELKVSVSSRSIVMSHSVEALKASVSSRQKPLMLQLSDS
jgi:hypothetical protein